MLKIAFDPKYILDLPLNHRFPMSKYELIPQQLLYEGIVEKKNFFSPNKIADHWLEAAHDREYIKKLQNLNLSKSEIRKTGFPLTKELVNREYIITQGTIDCVDYALKYGAAANIAGGTHHSFRNRGEGFCLFNDVATASLYALEKYQFNSILIIDLDVHQGNGTASILDRTLEKLKSQLSPELIFYISGVDILETDKLGRLNVTRNECKKRDELVYEFSKVKKAPVITVMGGGYSEKIYDIVEAHCNTFKAMIELI